MNSSQPAPAASGFFGLGIAPALLQILARLGLTVPTPIQHQAIPLALDGKDMVGVAQTGTGKTLAFGIPMIQVLSQAVISGKVLGHAQGLVLLPTRELALQVEEEIRKVGQSLGIRSAVIIGGTAMGPQVAALRRNPHVIIATPGRLWDHLGQRTLSLDRVRILVLDEADRMLDMGFLPQMTKIFHALPKERQTMLFSATLSQEIMKIAGAHMKLPLRIEVAPQGTTAERVIQEVFMVRRADKGRLLEKVLSEHRGSALVFSRTKFGAKRIMRSVRAMGHSAAEIHSNRSLNQRKEALEGFKSGRYRVLVATDIAARGIDVKGIELVINYDLPSNSADYVHRIGRTGRAGAEGRAISFALPEEQYDLRSIERLIRKSLPVSKLPELPPERALSAHSSEPTRSFGGSGRGGKHHSSSFGHSRPGQSSTSSRGPRRFSPRRPRF